MDKVHVVLKDSRHTGMFHCQFILQLLARSRQLSFVHDLLFIAELIRPRSQTASETCLSLVLREPVCQLQTSRCPTCHTARFLQRLSNNEHVDGRPLILQRCWAPNCQQMIVQTRAVCNTHWRSFLFYRWSTTQIERTVNQLQQKALPIR